MFIKNKYYRWYLQITSTPDIGKYTEVHHIIPKSLGGASGNNLVRLSYRKHFLAHWLLTKFTTGQARKKMLRALWCLTRNKHGHRILSSWQYEKAKIAIREIMEGNIITLGYKHTAESKAKISAASRRQVRTGLEENTKRAASVAKSWEKRREAGWAFSLEAKAKMSEASKEWWRGQPRKVERVTNPSWSSDTRWINDGVSNRRALKRLSLPKGWNLGRVARPVVAGLS